MSQQPPVNRAAPVPGSPKSPRPVSETLFYAAQSVAQQLQSAGWTWGEIEQICHFVLSIARIEGYARRRA